MSPFPVSYTHLQPGAVATGDAEALDGVQVVQRLRLMSTIHASTAKQKAVDSRGGSDWRTRCV